MSLLIRSIVDRRFQNLSNVLANSLPLRTLSDVSGRLRSLHESAELSPFSGPLLPCVEVSLLPSVELSPFSGSMPPSAELSLFSGSMPPSVQLSTVPTQSAIRFRFGSLGVNSLLFSSTSRGPLFRRSCCFVAKTASDYENNSLIQKSFKSIQK